MVEVGAGETRTVGSPDRVIMTRLDEVELERNLIGVEMMRADHTIYSTVTLESSSEIGNIFSGCRFWTFYPMCRRRNLSNFIWELLELY